MDGLFVFAQTADDNRRCPCSVYIRRHRAAVLFVLSALRNVDLLENFTNSNFDVFWHCVDCLVTVVYTNPLPWLYFSHAKSVPVYASTFRARDPLCINFSWRLTVYTCILYYRFQVMKWRHVTAYERSSSGVQLLFIDFDRIVAAENKSMQSVYQNWCLLFWNVVRNGVG